MKTRILFILIVAIIQTGIVTAQKELPSSLQKDYNNFDYTGTIDNLEKLATKDEKYPEAVEKLALAYYYNGKMEEASEWFQKLLVVKDSISPEIYFKNALALKSIQQYKRADSIMYLFAAAKPEDSRSKAFLQLKASDQNVEVTSYDYELENLAINTAYSDFGSSVINNALVFASSRDEDEKIYKWNNQPFLDLFVQRSDGTIEEIEGDVNTKYHESSTSFSKDGTTMYFTRNNYYKSKLKGDRNKTHKLKIYRATLKDGKWVDITPMPFNDDAYNVAHPALNEDGSVLYFASDMPGTKGMSDIYKVAIYEDGSYGIPENLGSVINTEARESFPFVSDAGTLYFSSNGHLGIGGLDVFKCEEISKLSSSSRIDHMGEPINSPKDDFGYYINEKTLEGYITSNRDGGVGDDDIYSFKATECEQQLEITVIDEQGNVIEDAQISLTETSDVILSQGATNNNGMYGWTNSCDSKTLTIFAQKEGYVENSKEIMLEKQRISNKTTKVEIVLQKEAVAEVGTDLFKLLGLAPIYFDYDKSFIRPDAEIELAKIIAYMNKFPQVKIDVRSHTDSRGTDAYNLALSERRNASTIAYIVEKGGIDASRITGRGYGETQLTNQCSNGVKCSKAEHQANRRSEFIVTEN